MIFLADVRTRATAAYRRIVFPETADERTRVALDELARKRIVEPIAILDPAAPETHDAVRELGVAIRDPATDPLTIEVGEALHAARRGKGITKEGGHSLAHTPLYFAAGLVAAGFADGCVAGAAHTTGEVLRAALWLVGRADGVRTVARAVSVGVPRFRR